MVLDEADRMIDMGFECQVWIYLGQARIQGINFVSDEHALIVSKVLPKGTRCLAVKVGTENR